MFICIVLQEDVKNLFASSFHKFCRQHIEAAASANYLGLAAWAIILYKFKKENPNN